MWTIVNGSAISYFPARSVDDLTALEGRLVEEFTRGRLTLTDQNETTRVDPIAEPRTAPRAPVQQRPPQRSLGRGVWDAGPRDVRCMDGLPR